MRRRKNAIGTPSAAVTRKMLSAQRAGQLPSRLGRWRVRITPPRGHDLADSCLHEAAHAVACSDVGAPVLASVADEGDGITLFDPHGLDPDDLGTIAVAGMSACGWAWIGLSDALFCAHCLALSGHGLPEPGWIVSPAGQSLVDRWVTRARETLARQALLHARLSLLLAARGAIVREDVERLAGPAARRGAASLLWERCRAESPRSVREVVATFVLRAPSVRTLSIRDDAGGGT